VIIAPLSFRYIRGLSDTLEFPHRKNIPALIDLWTYKHNSTDKGFTFTSLKKLFKRVSPLLFKGHCGTINLTFY